MNLFVIETIEEFQSLESGWNSLFQKNSKNTAFQSWSFNFKWWSVNRDQGHLHIICIGNNSKNIRFILPTYIDRKGSLTFLQYGSVDYLDALYDNNDNILPYLKRFREYVEKVKQIKKITLHQLKCHSALLQNLPFYYRKERYYIMQSDSYSLMRYENLDKEKILRHLKSKKIYNLKQIDKALLTTFELYSSQEKPFPTLPIKELIDKMAKHGVREQTIFHRQLDFMQKLYEDQQIFFFIQKEGENIVSISCLVNLDSQIIMTWMDLYDPTIRYVNLKNYIHIIRYCAEKKLHFDLGTGIYPYKINNFSPSVGSLFSFYYYKSPLIFIYYFFRKTVAKAMKKI